MRLDQSFVVKLRQGLRSAAYATAWLALAGISLAIVLALDESRRLVLIAGAIRLALGLFGISLLAVVVLLILRLRRGWAASADLKPDLGAAVFAGLTSYLALAALPGTLERRRIDHDMVVQFGRDALRITGGTGASLPRLLEQGIAADYPLQRVHLANPGGDVGAGQRAAGILLDRGVRVAVIDGDCASACAYMAALFPERYLAPAGRLGYHDIRAYGGRADVEAEDRRTLIDRLMAQGLSRAVVERLLSTTALTYPTRRDLLRDGLISGCWDPARAVPAACPMTPK